MEKSVLSVLCLLLLPVLGSETNTSGSPAEMAQDQSGVPSKAEVWGYGVLMVTVISLASVAGVVVMPVMNRTFYSKLMTGLIGLAVGSLAASSVFHLIPGAFRDPTQLVALSNYQLFVILVVHIYVERTE